ncbi:ABC transporter substrate-binding protein [Puerhibacterium puerhi]|uniref:ABC transporter substrate-binding protein n=1 Tax=Puerhibacterium puerhi TaxID=2692623 RepID=UPI00135B9DF3|nr:ABC transporter substrate-binding protein [Puerhibacterium puerhi]
MDSSPVSLVLALEAALRGRAAGAVVVGLLTPLSGVMGIVGSAVVNCARLAAEQFAERTGRRVELALVDAGDPPAAVAAQVRSLVLAGAVDGLVGAHTSDVRSSVARAVEGRVPYVFTPPHEFARPQPASVLTGVDPVGQLRQALGWLARREQAQRWFLVGNDYVWPRHVHRAAVAILRDLGHEVVGERLAPLGGHEPAAALDAIAASGADGVLVSLVGRDGVRFHRAVAEAGVGEDFLRLCTALDESCLYAVGGDDSGRLYTAMPTFLAMQDDEHLRMLEAYAARFGPDAPVPGAYAEGCYRGTGVVLELCGGAQAAVGRAPAALGAAGTAAVLARAEGTELRVVGG